MSIQAQAVVIEGAGGPETLSIGSIDVRAPGATEVLVQVAAAGLNRADILQRKGVYPAPPGVNPQVPGLEFAGHVAARGSAVTSLREGDPVMGIAAGAAMATHLVVHERELMRIPHHMSLEHAAAVPEAFVTAFDAMFVQAELGMGQFALIHAVGSGVGTAALQLACAAGAIPIGTSRKAHKLDRCRSLGLVHGIDSSHENFAERVKDITAGRLCDVVLDTVGGKYLTDNLKALAPQGRVIVIGLLGGAKAELPLGLLVAKRARLSGSVLRSRPLEEKIAITQAFARAVLPLLDTKRVVPVVESVLPMAQIREAHARMESDDTFGKLVMAW